MHQLLHLGVQLPKVGSQNIQPVLNLLQIYPEGRERARGFAAGLQSLLQLLNPINPICLGPIACSRVLLGIPSHMLQLHFDLINVQTEFGLTLLQLSTFGRKFHHLFFQITHSRAPIGGF